MKNSITKGIHHIGLTVSNLEASAAFFTDILDWSIVGRDESYPAIFVSDGTIMITLWSAKETPHYKFDKNRNIGLHHLAIKVTGENELYKIHELLLKNNIKIEFSPEFLRQGPAKHMMCYEPGGIRIEFIWPGN